MSNNCRPGDYITAKCTRCNDVTGHVITLVLGGEIAKVECKACGSLHKYRSALNDKKGLPQSQGIKKVRAGESRSQAIQIKAESKSKPSRSVPAKKNLRNARQAEDAWQESMVKLNHLTPTPYSMNTVFEVHDYIIHPTFGRGEVINTIKPDKIEVLFQDGLKMLRCKLE